MSSFWEQWLGAFPGSVSSLGFGLNELGFVVGRKLKANQLAALVEEIHMYLCAMPEAMRLDEDEAREKIVAFIASLPHESDDTATVMQVAGAVGDWLVEYLG